MDNVIIDICLLSYPNMKSGVFNINSLSRFLNSKIAANDISQWLIKL